MLFDRLIDINPRTGLITFNGKRMTLISASALGILRRDLVATLSMERAKGFLMRYGWACGQGDAQAIRSMFNWDSEEELLLAGPTLHTLEGIVTVEPWELKVDWENRSMLFTGEWRHSYEAEEHLFHFGCSEEPVCWTLVGYASGYLSEVFGRTVLAYELECRGKGDPRCVYVAKTLDRCNEAERQLARYYETESLATELDMAYQRITHLNETLMESMELHKRLSHLVFDGKNLSQIVQVVRDVVQRSVLVENRKGRLLAEAVTDPVHRDAYRCWKTRFKGPVWSQAASRGEQHDHWECEGLFIDVFAIGAGHTLLGHLCLVGDRPVSEEQHILMERAVNICALQMFYEQLMVQDARRRIADFLEDILSGRLDEPTLIRRARLLDIDPEEPRRVVAIRVEPQEELEEVCEYIRQKFVGFEAFTRNRYIVGLLPEAWIRKREWELDEFLMSVALSCVKKFKAVRLSVGCGRRAESVRDIGSSYDDALKIADFIEDVQGTGLSAEAPFGTYEQFQTLLLLIKAADHGELVKFYRSVLGRLEEYDRTHQGELLPTLRAYLEYTGNVRKVAGALYVSETGLRYRLKKIEELCGVDLDRGQDRFKIQLALQIHDSLQLRRASLPEAP